MAMTIKSKISLSEYRNLLFGLAYKKPIMKLVVFVGFAMVVWITGYYFHFLPVPRPRIYQYITLVLIAVVQPLTILFTIKRNYDSSNQLGEELAVEFTQTQIKVRGESFYMEVEWKKLFKIEEQTDWFLLYQNNLSAIIIPKRSFHGRQAEAFRNILRSIPGVPVHVKST